MPATLTPSFHRVRERATISTDHRVNREAGVIRGVRVCGESSVNGRRYPLAVLRQALPLYEGCRVYADHDYSPRGDDRSLRDWVGVLENVKIERNAVRGDLRLRRESQHFAPIMEAAEGFHRTFGLSHVIDAASHREGKIEVVDEIREVFSVDCVSNPATNHGLFESAGQLGGKLAGGVDGVQLDSRFQEILGVAEELGELPAASSANLRLIEQGRYADLPQDSPFENKAGYSLIDNQAIVHAREVLFAILDWWQSLPVQPEAKQVADQQAQLAQLAAMEQKVAQLEARNPHLVKYAREDRDGEAIFQRNAKRLGILTETRSTSRMRTPEEIFNDRQTRLEQLKSDRRS